MYELKSLAKGAIPRALERAERYRLLNEPWEAESICQDILRIEEGNQQALITLLLSMTDQFDRGSSVEEARDVLRRIQGDYLQEYYAGIICERRAKSLLDHGGPGVGYVAYEWFRQALDHYGKAEAIRPAGNDDSILRWNTCVRLIARYELHPEPETRTEMQLE